MSAKGELTLAQVEWTSPTSPEDTPMPKLRVCFGMDPATCVVLYFVEFVLKHRQTAADNARDAAGVAAAACFCEIQWSHYIS